MAVNVQDKVASAVKLYARDRHLFDYFRGGMPLGYMVVAAVFESDGKMVKGDPTYAEFGIFQVASHTETQFGVPKNYRMSKAGNYFLAGCEYNSEALRVALEHPDLVTAGSKDAWLLSRLTFALGKGGVNAVLRAAKPTRTAGEIYPQIIAWARRTGAFAMGASSAKKIQWRILSMQVMWDIGVASGLDMTLAPPILPPLPPGLKSFKVPADLQGEIKQQTGGEGPAVFAAADFAQYAMPLLPMARGPAAVVTAAVGGVLAWGLLKVLGGRA